MSSNIDTWTTIALDDFEVDFDFDAEEDQVEWIDKGEEGAIKIELCEDGYIKGVLEAGRIHVNEIHLRGEGSGWALEELRSMASSATGRLDALLIWEGGDRISRLVIENRQMTDNDIDLVALIRKADGIGE